MLETIAVTGGSGKVGSHIVERLSNSPYRVANLDRERPSEQTADAFVQVDLLDAGEVYGALGKTAADAVIHMGTVPDPLYAPEYATFENNVMSTYHLLEAAMNLELEAVCLPSSINVLGHDFQEVPPEISYLPVDEDHPLTPRDPYGLGKQVIEVIADGFGRLPDPPTTITSLRYPYAATTDELREFYVDTDRSLSALQEQHDPGDNPLFQYVHVDDIARAAILSIEADFDGHEAFWIVAQDTTVDDPTEDVLEVFYPDTERTEDLSGHDSLITPAKAEAQLGWTAKRNWRDL